MAERERDFIGEMEDFISTGRDNRSRVPDQGEQPVTPRDMEYVETHNRNPRAEARSAGEWMDRNRARGGYPADPQRGEYIDNYSQSGVFKDEHFDNSPVIARRAPEAGHDNMFMTNDLTGNFPDTGPSIQDYYNEMVRLDTKPARTAYEERALNELRTFFTNRTGMAEGGSVERDPVSGNKVPPGSEPHNVRDDIPAMLSEGEFVIPANVVNYYGVSKFDKMIDDAEAKLEEMDQKGRIGGEDDGMFLGGLFGGSRNSNNSSNYPWSNVEVAQAPLFDMYQWIFPGISAFWETTTTKPKSASSKEKPEDKIKWVYQRPEREEGGGSVDPNSNLWTMDKGKFRQIASTGKFNPLDNLFGRFGEKFQGIASQSRKAYLRAALEVAKERGMDQDIVSGLEQKLESLGGYQEVEGEGLLGREGSRLSEITGPARWEQVYNYHSAQAGMETIPDPKNPYTAPGADRPQSAGGPPMPGSLGERINRRIDRTVERITGDPVVDDVLTTVEETTREVAPEGGQTSVDRTETPDQTPSPAPEGGRRFDEETGYSIGPSGFPVFPVNEFARQEFNLPREGSVYTEAVDPTSDPIYYYELTPQMYDDLIRSGKITPEEEREFKDIFRGYVGSTSDPEVLNATRAYFDRYQGSGATPREAYVPTTPRVSTPQQPENFYGLEWESLNRNLAEGREQYVPATSGRPTSTRQPFVTVGGVEYGIAPRSAPITPTGSPDLPRTRTIDPNIRQGDRGIDWAERTQGFPTDVYNRGYQEPPKKYESVIDQQIAEALGDVARNVKERLTSIRGAAFRENRPDDFLPRTMADQMDTMLRGEDSRSPVGSDAIGEIAAREERGGEPVAGFSGEGEGPTQPPNPQPYNEPSPTQDVNIGNNSGGNAPPQEDYDDEGAPFYKGGYVQRPVSYAKGGYVTRKKGK